MKFTIQPAEMLHALSMTVRGGKGMTTMQVHDGRVHLAHIDAEALSTHIVSPAECSHDESEIIHVNASMLTRALQAVSSDATIEHVIGEHDLTTGHMMVSGDNIEFELYLPQPLPMPTYPAVEGGVVDLSNMVEPLRRAAVFASEDASRPTLTGVNIAPHPNGIAIAATDSYRMSWQVVKGESTGESVSIPASALKHLAAIAGNESVGYVSDENYAVFHCGDSTLQTTLILGAMPDYARSIDMDLVTARAVVKAEQLSNALAQVSMDSEMPWVDLEVEGDQMTLKSAGDEGRAEMVLKGVTSDQPFKARYQSRYLASALGECDVDATLHFRAAVAPSYITSGGVEGWIGLVMPVRP